MTVDFKKSKLKYHLKVKNGREVTNEVNYDDNVIDVYGSGGVFKYTDKKLFTGPSVLFGRKGTIGKPLYVEGDFWTVDTMYYTEIYSGNSPRYFYYLLEVFPWNQIVTQTALPSIVGSEVENYELNIPSEETQKIVAKYLECKCVEIEALLKHKENLITLLEQQRLSIITEAVTKGLNPNVKMKDSGVEWIGEIPEQWKETKLKFVIRNLIDAEHKTAPYELDGDYLVARTTNIKKGKLILDDAKYTNYAGYMEWTERGVPKEGDVLLTREAPAGEACVVPQEPVLCLGQRVVLLKLAQQLNSHFLVLSIYGGMAETYIKLLSQGSTVSHFNMADIKNIPLLLPTIEEQEEIVHYINSKIDQFDKLIEKIQTQIKQLVEYRQSLIYEAVTGKIDIHDMELD
ncbi:restriction endonuclease subunit S [Paenibacillus sp. FSL R5-0749]|uniref:restriction endonuclease subunit S n=1 Tax=Paenibacillus sp. FSL R5-0749 TaxID=2921657 RepID=UPI00315B3DE4